MADKNPKDLYKEFTENVGKWNSLEHIANSLVKPENAEDASSARVNAKSIYSQRYPGK